MSSMTISNDGDMTRVTTEYKFSRDTVSLSVLIPTANQTLLETQALAFEAAADHLSKLANSIRLQIDRPD